MEGASLIAELANATGLPSAWVEDELRRLLQRRGLADQGLTLELLREVLADFMQDVLLKAKDELNVC